MPTRTVAAAKSWLCNSHVDRHQPILPHGAPAEVAKVSPVEASRRYLEHLVAAWEAANPNAPVREQHVVLTVPASFDASARELTREAAIAAGLPDSLVLLEEPQAAVYAWLADRGERWRRELKVGDTLLICDVGGGTTDLTLIGVTDEGGELSLRRIAVGNHILVGGDNMDLALAHMLSAAFADKGTNLDPWQSVSLWHSCRAAKESLFSDTGPKKHPVSVLGRGSKLIGGTITVDLDRKSAAGLLLDGFFPQCAIKDQPAKRRASGFREIGLPFESDTAITRHLAAFLTAHGDSTNGPIHPTHILFNGGVFKADMLRQRLLEVAGSWSGANQGRKDWKETAIWIWLSPVAPPTTAWRSRAAACHSRRGGTFVLRRHRDGRAGNPRRGPTVASIMRRAVWNGGRHRARRARSGNRCCRGGTSFVPVLQLGRAKARPAGRFAREFFRGRTVGNRFARGDAAPGRGVEDAYVPVRFHSRITEWACSSCGA